MLPSIPRILFFTTVLLVAGCNHAPRKNEPAASMAKPSVTSTYHEKSPHLDQTQTAPEKKVLCPPEPMPALKVGDYAVWIDSEPEGGIVVVDGVPLGRTPFRVVLTGTGRGFCRDNISIKVRFVAADSDHTSQTIEETLTPLDKIPERVHFTLQGATRVVR